MISIQIIGRTEIANIRDLALRIWPQVYDYMLSKKQIEYMLEYMYSLEKLSTQFNDGHLFAIAQEGDQQIGFTSFHETERNIWRLEKLYVEREQQGKGYGQLLLDFVIHNARQQKIQWIELNVNRNNKALAFYKKNGFEIIEEVNIDIGDGFLMNDYIMRKKL